MHDFLKKWLWVCFSAALFLGLGRYAFAADAKDDLPVPRFAAIKFGEVRLRQGPGERFPVVWVFSEKNMPVEIIQQYDVWRKIRDWEGSEGWVHVGALQSNKRWIIVKGAIRTLRHDPDSESSAAARVEPGVLGQLNKCPNETPDWCQVGVGDLSGWIKREEVWGVYPKELYPQP